MRFLARSVSTALVLALAWVAAHAVPRGLALAPGDPAPNLITQSLDGEYFEARWAANAMTLVNFWATWCAFCREEMPVLQDLDTRLSKRGFRVVGVLLDAASDEDAKRFASDLGVAYTLVRGDQEISDDWGTIGSLPTSFLVDDRGTIVRRYVGATEERVRALASDVESLMRDRPASAQSDSKSKKRKSRRR